MNNWIDAEIINYPYNDPIEVYYYCRYCTDYDDSKVYDNSYGLLIKDNLMNKSVSTDLIYKWRLCQNLKTNGLMPK